MSTKFKLPNGEELDVEELQRASIASGKAVEEAEKKAESERKLKQAEQERRRIASAEVRKRQKAEMRTAVRKQPPPKKMTPREQKRAAKRNSDAIQDKPVSALPVKSSSKPVILAEGTTAVPNGSPRRALLEHLKALGGKATVEDLSSKMGLPLAPFSKSIKPLLSALAKGGWVKM